MTIEPGITEHEAAQVARANAWGAPQVVFVDGLSLLPSSWNRWVTLFEDAGYVRVTRGWPNDPESVAEAGEHPEACKQQKRNRGVTEIIKISGRGKVGGV
jgi:hypothetical protein